MHSLRLLIALHFLVSGIALQTRPKISSAKHLSGHHRKWKREASSQIELGHKNSALQSDTFDGTYLTSAKNSPASINRTYKRITWFSGWCQVILAVISAIILTFANGVRHIGSSWTSLWSNGFAFTSFGTSTAPSSRAHHLWSPLRSSFLFHFIFIFTLPTLRLVAVHCCRRCYRVSEHVLDMEHNTILEAHHRRPRRGAESDPNISQIQQNIRVSKHYRDVLYAHWRGADRGHVGIESVVLSGQLLPADRHHQCEQRTRTGLRYIPRTGQHQRTRGQFHPSCLLSVAADPAAESSSRKSSGTEVRRGIGFSCPVIVPEGSQRQQQQQ